MKTLIIAEAGVNHNGDLGLAKQLVDIAKSAEADMVKFQTFSADRLVTQTAEMAEYQKTNLASRKSQYDLLKGLELTRDMHLQLIEYCNEVGIEFFSTGFDIESIDMLIELGIEIFKIPSGEITNLPYLRHIGAQGKKVIMSSGMATISEIEAALVALETSGTCRSLVTVLHCTTEYPATMSKLNLRAIQTIKDQLNVSVGYSDHSQGIEISIAAVALGATVIEKHFTLDRNLPGPDHKASLEPDELRDLVRSIRNLELALGSTEKLPSKVELQNAAVARKSIVAARNIAKGELFTAENLTTKRPGSGISPMKWDQLIGSSSNRIYQADELIDNS